MTVPQSLLPHTQIFNTIQEIIPDSQEFYLVGGAVRDALLDNITHDLDFILPEKVQGYSRKIADSLDAAYYPLDGERNSARVVYQSRGGFRKYLDFTIRRGATIDDDLKARDFTINAMAFPLRGEMELIDPLGGASDLYNRVLRQCSPSAFADDPIRIIRAVRQSVAFQLRIETQTKKKLTETINRLPDVSPERVRDEIFRILDVNNPGGALNTMQFLGILEYILPELPPLLDISQSPPHYFNALDHSIQTVNKLAEIIELLTTDHPDDMSVNWASRFSSTVLGRFRKNIKGFLSEHSNPERSHRSLILFTALYHDVGKNHTQLMSEAGKSQFLNHEGVGAEISRKRAVELKLSNTEIQQVSTIVKNHTRPIQLTQSGALPSRRAVYRFFRDCDKNGVDICLLSLADFLAIYGPSLEKDNWIDHVNTIHYLLEAWWRKKTEWISPQRIVSGNDLINKFNLSSGPVIGKLLSEIKERQAIGEITNQDEAYEFTRNWLANDYG